ncbi:unnamed protein product [Rotaria magnacalcarata]|uniref:Uncharacterized protein n=1 Tax=Rotaria magnacalcarata TaxID=392030 RepID=A0A816QK32_9BILA|nr:unnamed protein product [Rotaria magnacalcarata]
MDLRTKFIAQLDLSPIGGTSHMINTLLIIQMLVAKLKLSEASQDIIRKASGQQRKSCSVVTKKIAEKQKEYVTRRRIKPFHVISKPLKSETHISDRLWLCDWLND